MPESRLENSLREDMNAARRQQDKDRARLLSTILSDIRNKEIEVGHELDDTETIEAMTEAEVLKAYMPQLRGRADGREVNRMVREVLESRAAGD